MPRYLFHHRLLSATSPRAKPLWRVRVLLPLLVLLAFLVLSSVGYWIIEARYTLLDAVYMTVITVGTVGYEEVGGGLSGAGRVWSIFVIVVGMVIVAVALGGVVAIVVEGRVRGIFGRRQLQRKISNVSGHVVVCGYGDMGRAVAAKLAAAGRRVVIVDLSPERTALAEEAKLLYVLGDAEEEETLQAAGIERAKALVSTLATDAENVFVTLSARQANRDLHIISRARDAASERKLRRAGANRVVCPQTIGASRMAQVVLRPAVVDFVEMTQTGEGIEVQQLELSEESALVGKRIHELALPGRAGIYIIAMQRAGERSVFQPGAEVRLAAGDRLILIGETGAAELAERIAAAGDEGDTPRPKG